jgi:hypothetical protein
MRSAPNSPTATPRDSSVEPQHSARVPAKDRTRVTVCPGETVHLGDLVVNQRGRPEWHIAGDEDVPDAEEVDRASERSVRAHDGVGVERLQLRDSLFAGNRREGVEFFPERPGDRGNEERSRLRGA